MAWGHQFKAPKIFLIDRFQQYNQGSYQEVPLEDESIKEDASIELQQQMASSTKITLYALLGSPSSGTMRVQRQINHQDVIILIDYGSTHNVLDASSWLSLKLSLSTQDNFTVKVTNSNMLRTQGACHDVNLKIQGQDFQVDLNVFSLDVAKRAGQVRFRLGQLGLKVKRVASQNGSIGL